MGATSGSLFDLHSNRIEEVINKNIETFLPAMDPVWRDTVVTSQGVGPASAIGRDMSIIKVYMGSMAGVLNMSTPLANGKEFGLYGDDTDTFADSAKLYTQNIAQTFPDATTGPNAKPYRLKIPMRAMTSNLMMTLGELQAEATPAFIGSVIAPKLEGFARLISHTICNSWYVSGNSSYQLGTVGTVVAESATKHTFVPTEKSVDRFAVGQRVDVFQSNGTTFRVMDGGSGTSATLPVFVGAVDEVKGQVTLVGNFSSVDMDIIAAGDIIKAHGTTDSGGSYGIAGINSWLKWDSTSDATKRLLGAEADSTDHIDVTVHPEFRSFRKGSVGALTEHKLRQYLHGFHRAKDKYGQYIDCLVASDGVWMNYESQKIGQYMIDRTGRPSSVNSEGSQEGFTFACDGRSYKGYTSQFVEKETVYGIRKGGNNWKRYIPPSQAGVQKFDKAESFIPFEFVAPALGFSGIKAPITKSVSNLSQITEGVQMPGQLRMQLVPDQPAGMKLEGVTEDRIYGDDT